MHKILIFLLMTFLTFGLFIQAAEAGRFGGGRSFGLSRSVSSFAKPASNLGQNFSRNQFGRNASSTNRWLGPLAGLAAGGLLASLFMSHGIGSGILSWLLVGGLLFIAINFIRNKMRPVAYSRPPQDYYQANFTRDAHSQFNNHPIGFDTQIFLRDAKVNFLRLQTAYDQNNLNDIREFTTPEVTAEIQLQLQERGNAENKTNVISLEAELLNVENNLEKINQVEMQAPIASVRFTGLIQESSNDAAVSINEIWHFKKEIASLRWIVAGVQQES